MTLVVAGEWIYYSQVDKQRLITMKFFNALVDRRLRASGMLVD